MWHRLSTRLILSVVLIEVVMLSILVWNSVRLIGSSHAELLESSIKEESLLIANLLAPGLIANDHALIADSLYLLKNKRGLVYMDVHNYSGEVVGYIGEKKHAIIHDGKPAIVEVDNSYEDALSDGVFDYRQKIELYAQHLGEMHAGYSVERVRQLIDSTRYQNAFIAALELILTIVVTVLIGIFLTRNLRKLEEAAHTFGKGELGHRIQIHGNDEIGDVARSFNKMANNIGEIQAQLEQRNRDLQESEQDLSVTLNSIGDAVIATDEKGNVSRMNPVAERLTGWQLQEAKGLSLKTIFPIINASTRESIANPVDKVISTGETVYLSNHTTLLARDGTEYQIADSAAPIRNGNSILGMVLVFNDVTEQYKLREEAEKRKTELQKSYAELEDRVQLRTADYLQAKEEAERANKAKSEFLSSMSHELRTPMNAILGFAQVLEMEMLDEQSRQNVAEIYNAGQHLLALINDVLDLSKIESENMELSQEDVNFNQLLEECLALIKPLAAKQNIRVTSSIVPGDVYTIVADHTRFKQIILNLLSNAVKYNRKGGSIVIDCNIISTRRLRISITDTGMGLSAEQQAQLFTPFERIGAETSEIEGTGIGLVITKRLVEMMGGTIGFDSQPGRGSTFWIDINLAVDAPGRHTISPAPVKNLTERKDTTVPLKTILYIEDHPANLRMVAQVIAINTPYLLISAPNATLGLVLAESQQPDLILMDINLPGMDGYEAMKQLQLKDSTKNITVIAISANAMKSDIDRGRVAGFREYLTKPFDVKELLRVINQALQDS